MFNVSPNGVGGDVAQSTDYLEQHGKHCGHSFLSKDVSKHEQKDAVVLPPHNNTVLNKRQFFTKWRPGDISTNYDHWMYKILMLLCVCLTSDAYSTSTARPKASNILDRFSLYDVSIVIGYMAGIATGLVLIVVSAVICKTAKTAIDDCRMGARASEAGKDGEFGKEHSLSMDSGLSMESDKAN